MRCWCISVPDLNTNPTRFKWLTPHSAHANKGRNARSDDICLVALHLLARQNYGSGELLCVWACVWGSKTGRRASCLDMNAAVYWLTGYMGEERSLGERRRGHLIGTSVSSDINSPLYLREWNNHAPWNGSAARIWRSGHTRLSKEMKAIFLKPWKALMCMCANVLECEKWGRKHVTYSCYFKGAPLPYAELHCSEHSWWQCPTGCDFHHCSHRRPSSELQVKVRSVLFLQKTSHSITAALETGGIVAKPEAQSHILLLSDALSFIHLH